MRRGGKIVAAVLSAIALITVGATASAAEVPAAMPATLAVPDVAGASVYVYSFLDYRQRFFGPTVVAKANDGIVAALKVDGATVAMKRFAETPYSSAFQAQPVTEPGLLPIRDIVSENSAAEHAARVKYRLIVSPTSFVYMGAAHQQWELTWLLQDVETGRPVWRATTNGSHLILLNINERADGRAKALVADFERAFHDPADLVTPTAGMEVSPADPGVGGKSERPGVYVYSLLDIDPEAIGRDNIETLNEGAVAALKQKGAWTRLVSYHDTLSSVALARFSGLPYISLNVPVEDVLAENAAVERASGVRYRLIIYPSQLDVSVKHIDWVLMDSRTNLILWRTTTKSDNGWFGNDKKLLAQFLEQLPSIPNS